MTRRRATLSTLLITLITALLAQFGYAQLQTITPTPRTTNQSIPAGFYRVTRVSDGDTIVVDMNGSSESIRFIGVDTPETHKPNTAVQCFGPNASDFTTHTLNGNNVRLEADPTNDNRDRYGRLLRYVYTADGVLINKLLIEQGYGFAYLSFPFLKKDEFAGAQQNARANNTGLWAACKPQQEASGRWQTPTQ